MSTLSPERWQQINPHLDHALSLSENERSEWLRLFRAANPDLADLLEQLLGEHRLLAQQRFLEGRLSHPGGEAPLSGQTVGAYTIISPIGQGGMGSVLLAERNDGRFNRRVAIKFLHFSVASQEGVERFRREGIILGQLAHPNIAELIDAGVSGKGEPYLVLEYVEGAHIDDYCDRHRLGTYARIHLFLDIVGAVAHAHSNLIVHRDIKPSNVIIRNDGRVKLLDFGIAKLLASDTNPTPTLLTLESGGALTPQFAAPERVTGGTITTATDIYSLGTLLYLLLTGKHPLGAGQRSAADLIEMIVDKEPLRASEASASLDANSVTAQRSSTPDRLRRQLRGDLDTILAKALKKNPVERYSSVSSFADDLQRYLRNEPISARPDTFTYRAVKFVRRNRATVALSTLAFLALMAGVAGTVLQARTASRQRDVALRERDRANRIADFAARMFKISEPGETRGNTVTAREILDNASKRIDTELVKDPDLQAQMMQFMGRAYRTLGLYPVAEGLLERAIDVGRRADGQDSLTVLSCMDDLGTVLTQEGRLADAERLQRQALAAEKRVLGFENPATLDTMSELAHTLSEEGRHQGKEKQEEALALARQTLDIERRVIGTDDVHTLWTMHVLAMTLDRSGQLAEAEKMQREELEIERRVHGPESIGALNAMANLGGTLIDMGRLPEAQDVLEQTREIQSRIYGPRHPETENTVYNLACVAARQGHRDQAFLWLGEAVEGMPPRGLAWIEKDSDLDSLHADPRWSAIVQAARRRVSEAQTSRLA